MRYINHSEYPQLEKAHEDDAGYDIYANENCWLPSLGYITVGTGLHVEIPKGWVGIIKSRSGNATKKGYEVGAGVIDSGYTGEVKVKLMDANYPTGGQPGQMITEGDKIAQLVVLPIYTGVLEKVDEFKTSERGDKGFGSSDEQE